MIKTTLNATLFQQIVDINPHLIIKSKKNEGIEIYFHSKLQKFLLFELYKDYAVCEALTKVKDVEKYIYSTIDSSGTGPNLQFKYPTTWSCTKKGRLHYTLDPAVWAQKKILELLLLLIN